MQSNKCDYKADEQISIIMADARLRPDKYGSWSSKHVSVPYRGQMFLVDYAYLNMLKTKVGDLPFDRAVKAYHDQK